MVELAELFPRIETVLPINSNDWEQVSLSLSENFTGWTSEAIRRNFNALVRPKLGQVILFVEEGLLLGWERIYIKGKIDV